MTAGRRPVNFRPDQALVFWLSGASPNPLHPFTTREGYQIVSGVIQRDPAAIQSRFSGLHFFDFDQSRLAAVTRLDDDTSPISDLMR